MPLSFDSPSKIVGLNYDDEQVLHAPALRFAVTPNPFGAGTGLKDTEDGRRLIAAVDAALARRAGDVEELEINFVYGSPRNRYIDMTSGGFYLFRHDHAADITSDHVAAWLRFGERLVTGRFTLAVPVPPRHAKKTAAPAPGRKLYAAMPASARSQRMSLTLGNATLAVPVAGAGAFDTLADVLLSHARIAPTIANQRNLGDLLSAACCPRLRRLRLEYITGLDALRLRAAATLEELRLDHAKNWKDMEEMMSPVPQLPNITSLTADAQWQHLEASIAKLIAKCSRLERLTIDISRPCDPCSNPHCFCNQEAGWDDQKISLEHLREGKITGLQPSNEHLSLIRRVIASAPALERMTVELCIGKELDCSSIPCNRGHWAPCVSGQSSRRVCDQAYEWTPGKKGEAGQDKGA
uniref:Uncharacterized protein n=1 Tax=Setaria italica TaxID=4555 RepID=K3ZCX8_SETIT